MIFANITFMVEQCLLISSGLDHGTFFANRGCGEPETREWKEDKRHGVAHAFISSRIPRGR